MADLYETDILEWSENQGNLLRRHAAGERLNEAPDWPNIIEEIEDLGRSEWHAVETLLVQAMTHMLKGRSWPESREVPHWQAEARAFRRQARRKFTPSMRAKIDLTGLYDDAIAGVPTSIDGQTPTPLPNACPWKLDELLSRDEGLS